MTLTAFLRFAAGRLYQFDEIDRGIVEDFRHHLIREGLKPNTVSFYICKLRAVYNRCVIEGYAPKGVDPFETVCVKVEKTRKLAVDDDTLRRVAEAELSGDRAIARDLFLLSFFCRGMSFVDMAYLLKSDIRGGTLFYRRRKTGQLFGNRISAETISSITDRILPEIQSWKNRPMERVYPILQGNGREEPSRNPRHL